MEYPINRAHINNTNEKLRGNIYMLKEFIWDSFVNTGSVEYYVFYKEIEEKTKVFEERKIAEEEAAISNV